MHPAGLPAAFGDGRDARGRLQVAGGLPAGAIGAEGGRQPRGEDRACPGETREEVMIWMVREHGGDLDVEGLNGLEQAAELVWTSRLSGSMTAGSVMSGTVGWIWTACR